MRPRRRGGGLIEVVVAAGVLAVGLLAVLGLQARTLELRTLEEQRDRARWRVRALADSIERGLLTSTGSRVTPWGRVDWGPAAGGAYLRAIGRGPDSLELTRLWTGVLDGEQRGGA